LSLNNYGYWQIWNTADKCGEASIPDRIFERYSMTLVPCLKSLEQDCCDNMVLMGLFRIPNFLLRIQILNLTLNKINNMVCEINPWSGGSGLSSGWKMCGGESGPTGGEGRRTTTLPCSEPESPPESPRLVFR